MIKRVIGILATLASLAVMVFVVLNRNNYQTLLPLGSSPVASQECVVAPESVEPVETLELTETPQPTTEEAPTDTPSEVPQTESNIAESQE